MHISVNFDASFWWYIARASGIVAWLMLTVTVLWGIFLATDLFPRWRRAAWLLDLHRWLAGLTIFFIAGHLGALAADRHAQFGVHALLIPFASTWRPTAVALGVIAVWLLLAVEITALAVRRLPGNWWRDVHIASYGIFWAVSIHSALSGTDASQRVYVITAIVALAAVVFATTYRALTFHLPKRKVRRAGTGPAGRPQPPARPVAPTVVRDLSA